MKKQRFLVFLLVLTICFGACATSQHPSGPGGFTYTMQRDETVKIQMPVPDTWPASFTTDPTASFLIKSPNEQILMLVTLVPLEINSDRLLDQVEKKFNADHVGTTVRNIEGTVSGHKVRGIQAQKDGAEFNAFFLDVDRGVYLIVLYIGATATDSEREAAQFMFERLKIMEDDN